MLKKFPEAYALQITSKGITITGYDERGAFYGIQTLRQIMESPVASKELCLAWQFLTILTFLTEV